MRIRLLLLSLLFACAAHAQSPEEMYGEFITPETRAILERSEQLEREIEASEAAAKAQKTLVLAVSVLIGLIPLGYIGRKIVREKTWKENPGGTIQALFVGLAGGAVLFGLNYGILLLKIKMGDAFNTAFAFLLVAAMVVGSVYLLNKNS